MGSQEADSGKKMTWNTLTYVLSWTSHTLLTLLLCLMAHCAMMFRFSDVPRIVGCQPGFSPSLKSRFWASSTGYILGSQIQRTHSSCREVVDRKQH